MNVFSIIAGWFKSKPRETGDVYKPHERLIYRYWNGKEIILADPLILYKRVMEVGPSISIDFKGAVSPLKKAPQYHDSLVATVRKVFSINSLADGGLTESESLDLLDHFLTYVESLQKKTSTSVILPTATSASSDSSSADSQPTPNTAASGSTGSESVTVGRTPSPTEQESPSA